MQGGGIYYLFSLTFAWRGGDDCSCSLAANGALRTTRRMHHLKFLHRNSHSDVNPKGDRPVGSLLRTLERRRPARQRLPPAVLSNERDTSQYQKGSDHYERGRLRGKVEVSEAIRSYRSTRRSEGREDIEIIEESGP